MSAGKVHTRHVGVFEWQKPFLAAPFEDVPEGQRKTVKAIGLALSLYADTRTGGNARPGHKLIAEGLDVKDRTVSRAVAHMEKAGYLKRVRRGTQTAGGNGAATVYQLTLPESAQPESVDTVVRSLGRKWGKSMDTGV